MSTEYAYAVGKIRALENKLLSRTKLEQLLELPIDGIIQKLENRGYEKVERASEAAINGNIQKIEWMLDEDLNKTYKLIKELAVKKAIINAFFLLNDGHNLKVLIKNKYNPKNQSEKMLLKRSLFNKEELKSMIEKYNFLPLPERLRKIPLQAMNEYEKTKSIQSMELIIDRGFYEYFREQLRINAFTDKIGAIKVDLINIIVFFRLKSRKKDESVLKQALINGGSIGLNKFLDNLSIQESIEHFIDSIKNCSYAEIIKEGYNVGKNNNAFSFLEKLADNFLTYYIREAKYISLGIEPLIGYLLAKENEIKNLRIIIFGKYYDWDKSLIKDKLREAYV